MTIPRIFTLRTLTLAGFLGISIFFTFDIVKFHVTNRFTYSKEAFRHIPLMSGDTFPQNLFIKVKPNSRESVAAQNFEKDKILCWIMTSSRNLDTKGRAVRDTWLKRCDISLFMSSEANDTFPTVKLNVSEGRHHLTAKTMQAFRYVYKNYFHNATWFLKADDDTYLMVENLRYFLSSENTSDPVYFGHHFQIYVKQGYHSGGAGYVLSKEALRRFGENQDVRLCKPDGANEDLEFGHCMENLGVRAGNSTDSHGNTRFHCLNLESHVFGNYPDWYWDRDSYAAKKKAENISEYAISFHYVQPNRMYLLDFYMYHLKVYKQ